MKQVDKLIVRSFLKSFISILAITLFILLIQTFYAKMNVIIGKNLSLMVYIKLFYYMGVNAIPLATPIAVLIATVLNFASLSENFELVALKNLGVSFERILRPLLISITIIAGGILFMTNYYVPRSWQNMMNMFVNLEQVNPLNSIKEGRFYEDIPGYSIYAGSTDKKKGELKNIIVYSTDKKDIYTVSSASAKLYNSKDKKSIIFQIDKGNNYLEMTSSALKNEYDKNNKIKDFMRMSFDVQKIFIDSSSFELSDDPIHSNFGRVDSIETNKIWKLRKDSKWDYDNQRKIIQEKLYDYYGLTDFISQNSPREKDNVEKEMLLSKIEDYDSKIIEQEISKNKKEFRLEIKEDLRLLSIYKKEYEKCTFYIINRSLVAVACIIMIILGACLGSLLKKGELGLAMVFATFFVIIYNVAFFLFEKMFIAEKVNLFIGSTGSVLVLLPFLVFFYIHAKRDSQIFKGDFTLRRKS